MSGKSLKRRSIRELLSLKYNIPEYQRGYRWRTSEVSRIIEDIAENEGKPYFMQVLVLQKTDDDVYNIVDGQQRLTTLSILLSKMNYELPKEITKALLENGRDYIDKKFIEEAKSCYRESKEKIEPKMILESFFLVYELSEDENAEEVFQRLNTGKIPLSPIELVRAMQISKQTDLEGKHRINSIFRDMEILFQQDEFYNFLCLDSSCTRYQASRLDYALELYLFLKENISLDDFFKGLEEDSLDIVNRIMQSQGLFSLEDFYFFVHSFLYNYCYKDYKSRNYVGCRIYRKKKVFEELKDLYNNSFLNNIPLDQLSTLNPAKEYKNWKILEKGKDDSLIKDFLLYYLVVRYDEAQLSFPFHEFFSEGFDIEHIHASNQREYEDKDIMDLIEKFKQTMTLDREKEIGRILSDFLNKKDDLDTWLYNQGFKNREIGPLVMELLKMIYVKGFENIEKEFVPDKVSLDDIAWINNIGNLVLLSSHVNRSFGNELFPMKCRTMRDKIKEGHFVAFCVREMYDERLVEWDEQPRDSYLKNLEEVFDA